jgi:hypothetical protein
MKVMTEADYNDMPAEYRGARGGVPYALYLGDDGGTVWGPVSLFRVYRCSENAPV